MTVISKLVMKSCLQGYDELGFSLTQDDHILELYFKDKFLARFSATGAGIASIRDECKRYLTELEKELTVWSGK